MVAIRERGQLADEDMVVSWVERHSKLLSASVRPCHHDRAQIGDNPLTENQADRFGSSGETRIGSGNGPKERCVERLGEGPSRVARQSEAEDKDRRP